MAVSLPPTPDTLSFSQRSHAPALGSICFSTATAPETTGGVPTSKACSQAAGARTMNLLYGMDATGMPTAPTGIIPSGNTLLLMCDPMNTESPDLIDTDLGHIVQMDTLCEAYYRRCSEPGKALEAPEVDVSTSSELFTDIEQHGVLFKQLMVCIRAIKCDKVDVQQRGPTVTFTDVVRSKHKRKKDEATEDREEGKEDDLPTLGSTIKPNKYYRRVRELSVTCAELLHQQTTSRGRPPCPNRRSLPASHTVSLKFFAQVLFDEFSNATWKLMGKEISLTEGEAYTAMMDTKAETHRSVGVVPATDWINLVLLRRREELLGAPEAFARIVHKLMDVDIGVPGTKTEERVGYARPFPPDVAVKALWRFMLPYSTLHNHFRALEGRSSFMRVVVLPARNECGSRAYWIESNGFIVDFSDDEKLIDRLRKTCVPVEVEGYSRWAQFCAKHLHIIPAQEEAIPVEVEGRRIRSFKLQRSPSATVNNGVKTFHIDIEAAKLGVFHSYALCATSVLGRVIVPGQRREEIDLAAKDRLLREALKTDKRLDKLVHTALFSFVTNVISIAAIMGDQTCTSLVELAYTFVHKEFGDAAPGLTEFTAYVCAHSSRAKRVSSKGSKGSKLCAVKRRRKTPGRNPKRARRDTESDAESDCGSVSGASAL